MKKSGENIIIGIDHGYGYIKTASENIIKSGVEAIPVRPPFDEDIFEIGSRVFVAGQNRSEHMADKTVNEDYYYLTLVGIAMELKANRMKNAKNVILAVGLPYSFFSAQKESFRTYLIKKKSLHFSYEGEKYHVELKDVKVYPQGLPVLAMIMNQYRDKTVSIADIGSRTIDVITYRRGKPFYDMCFSLDKKGTLDWIDVIEKYYLSKYQEKIEEEDIQCIFQNQNTSISKNQLQYVKDLIKFYVKDVMKLLESKIPNTLVLCGGGATVVNNFYKCENKNIIIKEDIFCNAKGYELLAYNSMKK